jgi:hypothetical protein
MALHGTYIVTVCIAGRGLAGMRLPSPGTGRVQPRVAPGLRCHACARRARLHTHFNFIVFRNISSCRGAYAVARSCRRFNGACRIGPCVNLQGLVHNYLASYKGASYFGSSECADVPSLRLLLAWTLHTGFVFPT